MLTNEQIREAVNQAKQYCDKLMVNYQMVSMRSALYALGYTPSDTQQILEAVAEAGFTHCLDASIAHNGEFPISAVCYWGPDQLKSRLWAINYRLPKGF